MEKLNSLVLEDDKLAQKIMAAQLTGHKLDMAGDLKSALGYLGRDKYDIGFFDLMLGPDDDYSGLKAIKAAAGKGVYSVVVSSSDSEDIIDKAYELGARDFYAKGNEESNIADIIRKFVQNRRLDAGTDVFESAFVTGDEETRAAVTEALRYAPTGLPVMILGPSGTGKTSLARIIHDRSGRPGSFVAINCSAYTEDLLEAELFGYKKGAFTGAGEARKGRLLEAHKGTLFLDEIGTMSPNMQMKLLKAIEEKTFHPLGSERAETSDFRIISATLEDPKELIARGRMRFDLFQRVQGYTLRLKPLTERPADLFPLIRHFTRGGRRLSFTAEARAMMQEYKWPGNAREVKKFVDLVCCGPEGRIDGVIAGRHLKPRGFAHAGATAAPVPAAAPAPRPAGGESDELYALAVKDGLQAALDKVAEEIVLRNLAENGGVRTKTMADLRISTRLLYSVIKKTGENGGDDD
jgi:DNA-binding NtrC family response regulator